MTLDEVHQDWAAGLIARAEYRARVLECITATTDIDQLLRDVFPRFHDEVLQDLMAIDRAQEFHLFSSAGPRWRLSDEALDAIEAWRAARGRFP